jgi:hypothetical protein
MPNQAIKITGLSLRDRLTQANTIDCCYFDVEIAGLIRLSGCLLKRTTRGGFVASPPKLASDRTAITILDQGLNHVITTAARELYILMGGAHGAYAGQERAEPDEPHDGSALSAILPPVDRQESH